jgi:hypothetical protein
MTDILMMKYNQKLLDLELLESRQLLSFVVVGVEINGDGDTYEIRLDGPGIFDTAANSLELITVTGTTAKSNLRIVVLGKNIDQNGQSTSNGMVDVDTISITGDIGNIIIEGSLKKITAKTIKSLKVDSFSGNSDAPGVVDVQKINALTALSKVTYTNFTFRDKVGTIKLGNRKQEDGTVTNSHFTFHNDVKNLIIDNHLGSSQITQLDGVAKRYLINGNVADSAIHVYGDAKTLAINGNVAHSTIHVYGEAKALAINGAVSRSDFDFDMSLKKLNVKEEWIDTTLDVKETLTRSSFKSVISSDPSEIATQISIKTIGRINIKNDIIQTRIGIDSDIAKMTAGNVDGLALRVNGNLGIFSTRGSLDNTIISVLNNINTIKVGKNLQQTVIVAGINIGEDYLLNSEDDQLGRGDLLIKKVIIGNNLVNSSIAVGILSKNGYFGDALDTRFIDDQGNEIRAKQEIRLIKVGGTISTTGISGESYALVAEDGIDKITSKGKIYIDNPDGVRVPVW